MTSSPTPDTLPKEERGGGIRSSEKVRLSTRGMFMRKLSKNYVIPDSRHSLPKEESRDPESKTANVYPSRPSPTTSFPT